MKQADLVDKLFVVASAELKCVTLRHCSLFILTYCIAEQLYGAFYRETVCYWCVAAKANYSRFVVQLSHLDTLLSRFHSPCCGFSYCCCQE